MKTITFVDSNIDHTQFVFPYKHHAIARSDNNSRPMFIPDYHAPLHKVYADNGYRVITKPIQQAWMESDVEPFVHVISPQPNIFALFREQPAKLKSYFQSVDPMIIDAVNEGRCALLIHNCKEQYDGDADTEQQLHDFFKQCGFVDPSKIIMIETSQNADTSDCFIFVKWNYFETAVRLMYFDIDVAEKFTAQYKKFLCLNFTPRYHRRDFMYAMRDLGLLDQFNASLNDPELPLQYDVDDHNVHLKSHENISVKPASGHIPMLVKDINHWNTLNPKHSTENLINIVTETPFQNKDLLFITEKTFKPFALKMPFIMLGNVGTMKYVQSIGYKTFDHMWSEEYDTISDKTKRMEAVCKLVQKLANMSNTALKKLVKQNYDVLEHNYNHLMTRRPEQAVFDAVDRIISHQ